MGARVCRLVRGDRACGVIMMPDVALILIAIALCNTGIVPCSRGMALARDQEQNLAGGAAQQEPEVQDAEDIAGAPDSVILRSGTVVNLVFAQSLSSKHAVMGERVELRVSEDVRVDRTVIVSEGARVLGTVVQGKKNEKYGNSKNLAVRVDYIVVKGRRIHLTGEQQQKPKTNIGSATAATIGLGLSGLMIYMNNREAWIREGAPAVGYVAEDVIFKQSELVSGATAQ